MNKKGFKEWLTDEDNLKRWKKYLTDSLQEKDFVSFFKLSSLFVWLNKMLLRCRHYSYFL